LAELQTEIEKRELSYEQQVALFHRIKDTMNDPDQHADALELMKELEQHPSLLAAVFKEINAYLSEEAPGRAPKAEIAGAAADSALPTTTLAPSGTVAHLSIRRPKASYPIARGYGIHVDGEKIGAVRDNQTATFDILAGSHTLYIQLDWVKSAPLHVTLAPGETANLIAIGKLGLGIKMILDWDEEG